MKNHSIGRQRLVQQRIAGERFDAPAEVVRWMGAMQAQDYTQALWAIGLRTKSATIGDVERAIEAGDILRTWPMRGTIHFIPPEDTRWMLALMASRRLAASGLRLKQLELTLDLIESCGALFVDALAGGKRLTRSELMALLEDADIHTTGQRGYYILWYLAQRGVICLGPMRGKEQTFVLLEEWAPKQRELSREEALAEIALRFFHSHGPATIHDLARWTGLTLTDARAKLATVREELMSVKIEGVDYWMDKSTNLGAPAKSGKVWLLPGFDEFIIGYKERSVVVAEEHAQKIVPGNNGVFQPTLVIDGQAVGTWKRKIRKRGIEITCLPFEPTPNLAERVATDAAAYGRFMELPVTNVTVV